MKRMAVGAAAAVALIGSTSARAATPTCVTPAEMNGLVTYFLPQVIDRVVETCGPHLSATSYLRTGLGARATELRQQADAAWPLARSGFIKIGSDGDDARDIAAMPDAALRSVVDDSFVETLGIDIKPDTCAEVNDISEALAPLSTAQTVHLIAVTLTAAARGDKQMASCPRSEAEQG